MVVAVGDTVLVPAATGVTDPMLLFIENEVASAVVHESTEDEPVCIAVGFAESVQTGAAGGGGGGGVTVVVHVTDAPLLAVAVAVYVAA